MGIVLGYGPVIPAGASAASTRSDAGPAGGLVRHLAGDVVGMFENVLTVRRKRHRYGDGERKQRKTAEHQHEQLVGDGTFAGVRRVDGGHC